MTSVIGVRLSPEDDAFIDALVVKNMSYRGTIARHLLAEKIAELRAKEIAQNATKEESQK